MTKRRLAMLLLLFVAGAIVNVAVAWGCALWSGASLNEDLLHRDLDSEMILWWNARFPERDAQTIRVSTDEMWGHTHFDEVHIEEACAFGIRGRNMSDSSRRVSCVWTGWPAETLAAEIQIRSGTKRQVGCIGKDWGPTSEFDLWPFLYHRFLPARPLWTGFAINTLFYAAILWLLFAAPFALLRRRRNKRGLCPKCAYPIGTNDVCTECGAAVMSQRNARRLSTG